MGHFHPFSIFSTAMWKITAGSRFCCSQHIFWNRPPIFSSRQENGLTVTWLWEARSYGPMVGRSARGFSWVLVCVRAFGIFWIFTIIWSLAKNAENQIFSKNHKFPFSGDHLITLRKSNVAMEDPLYCHVGPEGIPNFVGVLSSSFDGKNTKPIAPSPWRTFCCACKRMWRRNLKWKRMWHPGRKMVEPWFGYGSQLKTWRTTDGLVYV